MIPFDEFLVAAKWIIVLQLCGFAGSLFLINKGKNNILRYATGKAVGVIGLAAATWVLSILRLASFNFATCCLLLGVVYIALTLFKWPQIKVILKRDRRLFLAAEAGFLSLFTVGVILRSFNPAILDIEKYMDMAILTNLLRHSKGVPVDTWYSPDTINYYYFGHWIVAMIAKISITPANFAFNLGLPTALAIAGLNIFCLAWSLSKKFLGGALAVFLALFASNLHPFLSFASGAHSYFFYNSGRFTEQVINEYPLYSFILGDLHAHMLSLMLTTTFYGLAALLILEKRPLQDRVIIVLMGSLTGLIFATNAYDVIAIAILTSIITCWLIVAKKISINEAIKASSWFIISASIFATLFLASFKTAVGGLAVILFKIPILHIIWQFGLPLMLIFLALILSVTLKIKIIDRRHWHLAIIFGLTGLILIIFPQFIIIKDIYYYQNPPFALANTVFKIWYAAWVLIAIAAAVLASIAIRSLRKKTWQLFGVGVVILVCAVLSFGLVYGLEQITGDPAKSLNGTNYFNNQNAGRLKVINWVNNNIKGQPVWLQTYGESYSQLSWASSFTGLPTVLGWRSHEWGWRYSSDRWQLITARSDDIKLLYESQSSDSLKSSANRQNISYILIGPDERAIYTINDNFFNNTFGPPIYNSGGYKIYKCE